MKEFLVAVQFLTRIPVRIKGDLSEKEIGRSAVFFPVVGVLQGIPAAATALLLTPLFTPEIAAGVVVLVLLLINGGFHLDGLADTADGISVKNSGDPVRDRERRLAVMKDSAVGAMGAIAIVMILLLKYLFISALLENGVAWDALYALFLVPVFSKWIMVPVITHGRPARQEGLGSIFITHGGTSTLLLSSLTLAFIFACASAALPDGLWPDLASFFLLLALPCYVLGLLWVSFCSRKFGGITGDTIGAVSEVGEILVLALTFLWV